MSVHVSRQVWQHSRPRPTAKYVLLCIADHAHDDGTGAYPSVTRIATETGLSRRAVINLIAELERDRYLDVRRAKGDSNEYVIHPTGAQHSLVELVHGEPGPVHVRPSTGAADALSGEPGAPKPPEPPREPSQPQVVAVHEELYGRSPTTQKERYLASMVERFGIDRTVFALRKEYDLDPDPRTICGRMEEKLKAGDALRIAS